jgi:hypothetical protein
MDQNFTGEMMDNKPTEMVPVELSGRSNDAGMLRVRVTGRPERHPPVKLEDKQVTPRPFKMLKNESCGPTGPGEMETANAAAAAAKLLVEGEEIIHLLTESCKSQLSRQPE